MTTSDSVLTEIIGRTYVITMNRPEQLNAMNRDMFVGLAHAFRRFDEDDALDVAVLTGAGDRAFTAGVDVKELSSAGERGLNFPDITPLVNPFWPGRTNHVSKPIIAAVNGYAMGGGFYMALQADLCIATQTAQFELSEIHRGGVAGWEVGYLNMLPIAAWAEVALGARLTAQRAYDLGAINLVVEHEKLMDAALDWAARIQAIPPLVVRRNLELLRSLKPAVPDDIWAREADYIEEARQHPDTDEAMAAFFERRPPVWSAREVTT